MRVISRKKIVDFYKLHPRAKSSLESWYQIVRETNFHSFSELREVFPSLDRVRISKEKELMVFNIAGNNFRLIAAVHHKSQMVFIRSILTHAEYNKEQWKK